MNNKSGFEIEYHEQCLDLPCEWLLKVVNGDSARYLWLVVKPPKNKLRKVVSRLIKSMR